MGKPIQLDLLASIVENDGAVLDHDGGSSRAQRLEDLDQSIRSRVRSMENAVFSTCSTTWVLIAPRSDTSMLLS